MKKLTLDIETLDVQSFEAGARPGQRGTVAAYIPFTDPRVCPPTQDLPCSYGACTDYPMYCTEAGCTGYVTCLTCQGDDCA